MNCELLDCGVRKKKINKKSWINRGMGGGILFLGCIARDGVIFSSLCTFCIENAEFGPILTNVGYLSRIYALFGIFFRPN